MTLVPMYKVCPICKRRYKWNPDVGMMNCPRCNSPRVKILTEIFRYIKNRNKKER